MMRLVVGIAGSSAPVLGIRLLEALRDHPGVETHLVISPGAHRTIELESERSVEEVRRLASVSYDARDLAAPIASGSFLTAGMVVAPCSMRTLAAVAHAMADNLLTRAADVTLKERRPLVLVPRETPLHLGHLENMAAATRMGAIIAPPTLSTYHKPVLVDDWVDHFVGRLLDLLRIENTLVKRWPGPPAD